MAIDRFYAVIPAYEPDEKMLAVIDDISSLTDFHIIVINDGSGKDKLPTPLLYPPPCAVRLRLQ